MKKLYLAHPFPTRVRMREWAEKVEKLAGVQLFCPFYKITRKDIDDIDDGKRSKYNTSCDRLVSRDLTALRTCDGVLTYIDGSTSIGTHMEIVYAYEAGLPVYVIVEGLGEKMFRDSAGYYHPWIRYHATKIFRNLKETERWLKKMGSKQSK